MTRFRPVWLSLCLCAALVGPAAAQVSPTQGPPGTRVTLTTAPCTIDKGPVALFGDTVVTLLPAPAAPRPAAVATPPAAAAAPPPAAGAPPPAAAAPPPNASWILTLPALAAQPFPVKFRCGTPDAVQIGVFIVQPVVPVVTGAWSAGKAAEAHMDESIVLKVEQLKRWRAASATNQAATLRLYLAGVLLKNVTLAPTMAPPRSGAATAPNAEKPANAQNAPSVQNPPATQTAAATDPSGDGDVSYFLAKLEMDDTAGDVHTAWAQALRIIIDKSGRDVPASIGTDADAFPATDAAKIRIEVYPVLWSWIALIVAALLGVLLLWAAITTTALRDPNGAAKPPFSLARTQMAAWFYVIVVCYLFLWLVTGTAGAPSSTALTLMGISGATGLVATTMDRSKRQQADNARAALQHEKAALDAELVPAALPAQLAAAPAGSPTAVALTATIQQKTARQQELAALLAAPVAPAQPSENPLKDVLSDENGVTVHRLQMLTWTIVLIIVFVHAVWTDLVMPVFDATLLGLMGISAGAYLGFKFPEPAP